MGLAAFAYWKYKMTPEQRENLKSQLSGMGKKLKDTLPQDVKKWVAPQKEEQAI